MSRIYKAAYVWNAELWERVLVGGCCYRLIVWITYCDLNYKNSTFNYYRNKQHWLFPGLHFLRYVLIEVTFLYLI
jgi:hypothetical protein